MIDLKRCDNCNEIKQAFDFTVKVEGEEDKTILCLTCVEASLNTFSELMSKFLEIDKILQGD